IGAREHAERRADPDAQSGHDERADDGVEQATLVGAGRRRVLGEDLPVQSRHAVVEQRDQDQREPGDAEGGGGEAETADDDTHQHQPRGGEHEECQHEQEQAEQDQAGLVQAVALGELGGDRGRDRRARGEDRGRDPERIADDERDR
ncbi:hypothetical protein E4T56_gene7778, partial [Termitomyces sp. T112]